MKQKTTPSHLWPSCGLQTLGEIIVLLETTVRTDSTWNYLLTVSATAGNAEILHGSFELADGCPTYGAELKYFCCDDYCDTLTMSGKVRNAS